MNETEINLIPSEFSTLAQEAPKVKAALDEVGRLTVQLAPLKDEARTLEVKHPDRGAYQRIGEVLTDVRGLRKQGEAHLSPFNVLIERVRIFLRTATQKHTNACEEIEGIIKPKMKAWEQAELDATAAEQKQLEKKAARKGEDAPTVQHNIPATAGYRRSTVYRAEVTDREKFLRAYRSDPQRFDRYILIDVQKLNADLRETKDPAGMMKAIPGIKCWKD